MSRKAEPAGLGRDGPRLAQMLQDAHPAHIFSLTDRRIAS
jgi:hypothetical protein